MAFTLAGVPFSFAGVAFTLAGVPFPFAGVDFDLAGVPFTFAGVDFDLAGISFTFAGVDFAFVSDVAAGSVRARLGERATSSADATYLYPCVMWIDGRIRKCAPACSAIQQLARHLPRKLVINAECMQTLLHALVLPEQLLIPSTQLIVRLGLRGGGMRGVSARQN